jgi:hypothetical protein
MQPCARAASQNDSLHRQIRPWSLATKPVIARSEATRRSRGQRNVAVALDRHVAPAALLAMTNPVERIA